MPYTNDIETPNAPALAEQNPHIVYIEYTQGYWLRQCRRAKEIELWHDGKLITAYRCTDETGKIDANLVMALITHAASFGAKQRAKEISKLISG